MGIKTATPGGSRSSRPFASWNGTGHCVFHPGFTGLRWDKEKLASLVLRGQGRARFLEDVSKRGGGSCHGFKFLSQPHLTAEEHWNQLAGAVRRAGQSFLQVTRKRLERPEDTAVTLQSMLQARKAVVHSPVDPVALMGIRRAGFSAQYLPALFVLWRDLSAFWTARRKLDVLTRRDRQRSQEGNHHVFSDSLGQEELSLKCGDLAYRLSGRPVGPWKRVYCQMAAFQVECSEWSEFLSLAGHQGGRIMLKWHNVCCEMLSWQKSGTILGVRNRKCLARSFHVLAYHLGRC